ncbi:hypothetical protein V1264_010901 [Littorina saxatilis]|uniref:Reverse transcriptase n=1 Tax=Littorina saxatilis TaxID=31220 RepID=A0AAN9GLM4_9CAEN
MAAALPTFEHFPVHSDEATQGTRWKRWLNRFEILLTAISVTDKARKKALLLHYAGDEVFSIFESFTDEQKGVGSDNEYKTIVKSFNDHFTPKKNTDFETFKFRQSRQNEGESIDAFHTRLRLLAARCEFADADREIKAQILQGCTSSRLRKRALRDEKLTLTQLLDTARVLELSDKQALEMEGESTATANFVKHRHHSQHQPKSGGQQRRTHPQRPTQHAKTCYWCGGQQHPRDKCPAKDKNCRSCSKFGHFSKVCKSGNPKSRPHSGQAAASVKNIQCHTQDTEQSSSDEEYIFGVTGNSKTPRVDISLSGELVPFFIDTGASVNVIDEQSFKNLHINVVPSTTTIFAYGTNEPLHVLGTFTADVTYKQSSTTATFHVVRSKPTTRGGNLLSADTAEKLRIVSFAFTATTRILADTLCEETPALFEGLGKLKDVKVTLYEDKTVQPTAQPHRRIPYHMRKKVEEELQRLENLDIIEKVDGPTPWVSPIVVVPKPKKPDEIRICVDMRMPNRAIKRTRHIMPTIDDILMQLNQATVFSKLDLNSGYHQLELDEQSRNITTFSTHVGLRRYKRLNFGVTSAAEIFQNHIADIMSDIPGVMNTSDDILIHGKTQEEHDATLKKVFARMQEKNLTLNKAKCEFNKDTIEFYGFVFGRNGISPDPKKVEAVHKTAAPTNAKEVRSFLGLTNYISRFIPDYAKITKPLRDLTRNQAEWIWTSEHDATFNELKSRLTSSKVMSYYNPEAATDVVVDASPFGVGAVLTQRDDKGSHYTVAYASRALTDVEARYSQTEREALAVVWACEHFYLYLLGRHFTVISDHKPLEGIYNSATSHTSARIERWNLRLQAYDFTLRYQPGESNPADFLSRHPVQASDAQSTHASKVAEEYIKFLIDHTIPKAMTLAEVAAATSNDKTLLAVINAIQYDQWHPPTDTAVNSSAFQIFKRVRDELSVSEEHSILLRNQRIVIPKALQQRTVDIAHEGHQGIIKTKGLLREKVWFPQMDQLVECKVKSCLACLSTTPIHPSEPLKMTTLPPHPWSEVSIDFAGPFPSGEYLLVVTDDYSRFPEVEILTSTSAKAVIPKLDAIFSRFGIPDVVKSDNGPPFNGSDFKHFAGYLGFKHRTITPLWPQANGGAERCMPMLKKTIQAAQVEGKVWRQELYKFLRSYRATPHCSTGTSPAEALLGRKFKTQLPELQDKATSPLDDTIRQHDDKMKAKMKVYADARRHAVDSPIQVGDTVLVRQKRDSKLTPYYNPAPLEVTAKKGSMLTAKRPGRTQVTRNSSHFKKIAISSPTMQHLSPPDDPQDDCPADDGQAPRRPAEVCVPPRDTAEAPMQQQSQSLMADTPEPQRKQPPRSRTKPAYLKDYVLK